MALARKCDRCGRLHEYYPVGNQNGVWNSVQLIRKSITDSCILANKGTMDLCCYCMNDLQKFLQNSNMTVVEEKNYG